MEHRSFSFVQNQYETISDCPSEEEIRSFLSDNRFRLVVLDDDPTGIQTVNGCLLLTCWNQEALRVAFEDEIPFFYLLTNTRSLTAAEAGQRTREAVEAVLQCNERYHYRLIFVSRSDSTLRGHFPLEPETMQKVLKANGLATSGPVLFIPAFFEAGRYTLEGIHYVRQGDELVPAAETEFASDNVFAYSHSDLTGYILEKTRGTVPAEAIGHLDLNRLRNSSDAGLQAFLTEQETKRYLTIDALEDGDLRKLSMILLRRYLMVEGFPVLRTSSSLPKALSGCAEKPLLGREELVKRKEKGLFVVGSHVKKSSEQLSRLLTSSGTKGLEINIQRILEQPETEQTEVLEAIKQTVTEGYTPVLFTSRTEIRLNDADARQKLGQTVSNFLTELVRLLPFEPAYLVAKGGITSHDILTHSLEIRSARVAGQILPGVPVLQTPANHRWPNLPYIIFPGNVGETDSLLRIFSALEPN